MDVVTAVALAQGIAAAGAVAAGLKSYLNGEVRRTLDHIQRIPRIEKRQQDSVQVLVALAFASEREKAGVDARAVQETFSEEDEAHPQDFITLADHARRQDGPLAGFPERTDKERQADE